MIIAFYIDEMNFRGVANSTYQYAIKNIEILKNNSIIFYNKKNKSNKKEVIEKFKKKFKVYGIDKFSEIDKYKKDLKIKYLYTQKSGNKDEWISKEIKTLVHSVYPQKLKEIHGYRYAYISEWLSAKYSNCKIPFIPLIVESENSNFNLKKKLRINEKNLIFGCHGGESSFDMSFAQTAISNIVKKRKDITFIFLNIDKFCNHPQIKFLKGTSNEKMKREFINTCDAMIYGRSLGESFGLACGEFILQNKPIISYKFNRHRSHNFNVPKKYIYEYGSYNELNKILSKFKKNYDLLEINSKYKDYSSSKVMDIFRKVFLGKESYPKISVFDYFTNYKNHLFIYYYYLRHKIYHHYFNLFESKFVNLKELNYKNKNKRFKLWRGSSVG